MFENNEKIKEEQNVSEKDQKDTKEISDVEKEDIEIKSEVELETEVARDRMLRIAADYDNYKKRAEKEKSEFMKYATERFIKDLLPTIDDLERAITSSNDPSGFEAFREGVQIIYKQLNNVLTKYNVTPIEAIGKKFDPNLHEAMMQMPSAKPEESVIQEFQKGYILHDRIIRPSKVVVSAGNPLGEEDENE